MIYDLPSRKNFPPHLRDLLGKAGDTSVNVYLLYPFRENIVGNNTLLPAVVGVELIKSC